MANTTPINPIVIGLNLSYDIPINGSLNIHPTVIDPNNYPLTYYPSRPPHGNVSQPLGANDPSIVYTPNKDYVGSDTFTYVVMNGRGGTAEVRVKINVGLNQTPQASPSDNLPATLVINGVTYKKV